MANDILQGQWKQIRGQIKDWWGKLTDDDVQRVEGNRDKLIGALQERYGYSKLQAQEEVDRRLLDYERRYSSGTRSNPNDRPSSTL